MALPSSWHFFLNFKSPSYFWFLRKSLSGGSISMMSVPRVGVGDLHFTAPVIQFSSDERLSVDGKGKSCLPPPPDECTRANASCVACRSTGVWLEGLPPLRALPSTLTPSAPIKGGLTASPFLLGPKWGQTQVPFFSLSLPPLVPPRILWPQNKPVPWWTFLFSIGWKPS